MPARKSKSLTNKTWKDIQSKRKKDQRNKLALLILGVLIGFLVLSWAIRLTQSLFSSERNYMWDANFNLNLVIRTNDISILSFNPAEKRVVIINIPDETFLEVPNGFGFWQLRAVYKLGESQKDKGGDRLLMETLRSYLGIPIDGFVGFSGSQSNQSAAGIIEELRQNPFSGFNLISNLKTDLTLWELIRLELGLTGVRFDKIKEINLEGSDILTQEILPDGTEVLTADPVKLDSILVDLTDPAIVSEHKSIAVFNATDRPLLAQKAARLITNLGGNVIIISNAEEKLKKTQVLGIKSKTIKRLKQIFDLDDKMSSSSAGLEPARAEINIFLGESFK